MKGTATYRRALSLADQMLQAVGNLGATILLARWLSIDDYAVVATAITIWFFFEAIQRTGILTPYVSSVPRPAVARDEHSLWFYINLSILMAGSALLLLLGFFLSGVIGRSVLLSAAMVPCAGLFAYGKRVLYHIDAYGRAIGVSIANIAVMYTCLLAIACGALPASDASGAMTYVIAYLSGGLLSGIFLWKSFEPPRSLWTDLRARIHTIWQMSASAIAGYFYNNGMQFVLASFAKASEAAAFAATRIMVRPLGVLNVAIVEIERSTAARLYHEKGEAALDHFLNRLLIGLLLFLAPIAILLYIYTPAIMSFIFKGKYDDFSLIGQVWIIALIPQILALPLDIRQAIQSRAKALLGARVAGALACLAVIIGGWWHNGTLTAIDGIASVGAGRAVTYAAMLYAQYWRRT